MWSLGTFWCIRIVSTTFLSGNAKNHGNYELRKAKNRFSTIFPKITILRYILLHNLYINMAIRHILVYENSLYDVPGLKYKNSKDRETLKKGVAENARIAFSTKMQ